MSVTTSAVASSPSASGQNGAAQASTSPVKGAAAAPTANAAPAAAAAGGAPAPGAAGPGGYTTVSLYVGDLAPDVTEALLFEIFNAVGPVASVRVCRDVTTRRSLGYSYVNFHRPEDAERALDTMNFKNIRNKPCRIMWSHRDPTLRRSNAGNIFIKGLSKSIDNKQLYDHFSMFGNILSCKCAQNASTKEYLGYGFVHYESEQSAQAAIDKRSGTELAGEKIEVGLFRPKKDRPSDAHNFTNVFVKNLPGEYTKEQLESLFAKFGTITSSMILKSATDDKGGDSSFGFVNFSAPEQATEAVEKMHDSEVQGKKLFVSRAQKKEEREKELRDRFEQLKQERAKKYAGVNLYVKNLSEETTDEKLSQEFGKYGQITSAHVMKDGQGKSRGFGFVCFATPEEATRAVTEMNGRLEDDKPLYVALAQRKETRRQHLEAQYAARLKIGAQAGSHQMFAQQNAMMFGGMPPQMRGMNNFMYPQGGMGGPQAQMRFMPQASPLMQGGMQGPQGQRQQFGGMPINNYMMPNRGMQMAQMPQAGPMGAQGQVLRGLQPSQLGRGPQGAMGGPQMRGPVQQAGRGPQGQQMPVMSMPQGGMMMPPGGLLQGKPGMPPQQQPNIRYSDNVRNRAMPMQGAPMMPNQGLMPEAQQAVSMPAPNEPLTIKALAAAPEEMRKQMIGERLFPLIKMHEPVLAGKITGMLLEMDNGELIHLLESQPALNEKIHEALAVLQAHPQHDQTEQQGEEGTDK